MKGKRRFGYLWNDPWAAIHRRSLHLVLLIVSTLFVHPRAGNVTPISSPEELAQGIASGFFHVVLDVRTLMEFQKGHLPRATLVENLNRQQQQTDPSVPAVLRHCQYCSIVVYCASGRRAKGAIEYLQRHGFQSLYFYAGGMNQWSSLSKQSIEFVVSTDQSQVPPCSLDLVVSRTCESTHNTLVAHSSVPLHGSPYERKATESQSIQTPGDDSSTGVSGRDAGAVRQEEQSAFIPIVFGATRRARKDRVEGNEAFILGYFLAAFEVGLALLVFVVIMYSLGRLYKRYHGTHESSFRRR